MPPTAEPPPRYSLPATRRPASLSLSCDDFHTALATLAHRRRLPHAVAQHYAVPSLAVPPPCSHHCAQARQPRCRVTRIVNSAVISATPRCTPTPASLLPLQRRHRLSYKLAAVRVDAERPQPQSPPLMVGGWSRELLPLLRPIKGKVELPSIATTSSRQATQLHQHSSLCSSTKKLASCRSPPIGSPAPS